MRATTRFLLLAVVLLAALTAPTATRAQPCGAANITVLNGTNCPLVVCLWTAPAVPCTALLAPNGVALIPVPPGTNVIGVFSNAGAACAFVGGAPPPYATWFSGVFLAPGCCCDVLYDPVNCLVKVIPNMVPPPGGCVP